VLLNNKADRTLSLSSVESYMIFFFLNSDCPMCMSVYTTSVWAFLASRRVITHKGNCPIFSLANQEQRYKVVAVKL